MSDRDTLGREIYAKKIAKEIIDAYSSEKTINKDTPDKRENLIFAISGKWGEGKSFLLEKIEKELALKKFRIIRFNPWKYSQKDITLKRAFLHKVRADLKKDTNLEDLYFDRTNVAFDKESWAWLKEKGWIYPAAMFVATIAILFFLTSSFNWLIKDHGLLDNLILLILGLGLTGILGPLLVKMTVVDKKSAAIATAEQFEEKFYEILEGEEKIVILIDDLDRCNSETVQLILDSIKTFFQHPECSYIITGDHTVIEKFASKTVDGEKENLQEGRRYLKKLFDVYWRLPLPTPNQINTFIEDQLNSAKLELTNDEDKKAIKTLLSQDVLFERNPRHIKRFIRTLEFAIDSIKLQKEVFISEGTDSESAVNDIDEILKNIPLLAKVLVVQETCFPIYEKLVLNPQDILQHEKKARAANADTELKFKIEGDSKYTEECERTEIIQTYEKILLVEPKFTDPQDTTKHDPSPYLTFSGSTGLPSLTGPDETRFMEYLKAGTLEQELGEIIKTLTDQKAKKYIEKCTFAIKNPATSTLERKIALLEIFKLSRKLTQWAGCLQDFLPLVFEIEETEREELRAPLLKAILIRRGDLLDKVIEKYPNWIENAWTHLQELTPKEKEIDLITQEYFSKKTQNELNGVPPKERGLKLITDNPTKFSETIHVDLTKFIDSKLQDLATCKNYILQSGEHQLMKEKAEVKMKEFVSTLNDKEWLLNEVQFLIEHNLFDIFIESVYKEANQSIETLKWLIQNLGGLRQSDAEGAKKIFEKLLNWVDNNNLKILDDEEVKKARPLFSKDMKMQLFKKMMNILRIHKNTPEIKTAATKLLNQDIVWWEHLTKDDMSSCLDELSKIDKPHYILKEIDNVLNSWDWEKPEKTAT